MERLPHILSLVAYGGFAVALAIYLFLRYLKSTYRDAPKLRAIGALIFFYSFGIWTVVNLYWIPLRLGLSPTISRENTFTSLDQPGAYFRLYFHLALGVLMIVLGTYWCLRIWRSSATKA